MSPSTTDFAHHPSAVRETVAALRAAVDGGTGLGGIRAAFGDIVPACLSGRLRGGACTAADEVIVAPVFRSALPVEERLSVTQLVDDLVAAGTRARHLPTMDAIGDTIVSEAQAGDRVVLMSNGDFGGLRETLCRRLGAPPAPADG